MTAYRPRWARVTALSTADPQTDHRADIYAPGALGHGILSGRLPFTVMNVKAMLAAQ